MRRKAPGLPPLSTRSVSTVGGCAGAGGVTGNVIQSPTTPDGTPVRLDLAGGAKACVELQAVAARVIMRAAGKPIPGVEVKIVGPDGATVPTGEVGEIVTRSSNNMLGYWKRPDATRATKTADNWVHTGDAGYMDADGYVYIHDRVKDMIISGGENVYPAEVENAIYGHPDVADVAVIGVPDATWGEAVKAVVVPRPGHTVDAASVIAWARERIAGFKVPKTVDVIPELPRNPTGKILRRSLRAPYWEGRERQVN